MRCAFKRLVPLFPDCFFQGRPLKRGIHDDLVARGVGLKLVYHGLHGYTDRVSYLMTIVAGVQRIDLDGNDAGEVTPFEEEFARRMIANKVRKAPAQGARAGQAATALDRGTEPAPQSRGATEAARPRRAEGGRYGASAAQPLRTVE
jgi:ProP effector